VTLRDVGNAHGEVPVMGTIQRVLMSKGATLSASPLVFLALFPYVDRFYCMMMQSFFFPSSRAAITDRFSTRYAVEGKYSSYVLGVELY
jgi:hypothetical protein